MNWYYIAAGVFAASALFGVLIGKIMAWAGRFDDA